MSMILPSYAGFMAPASGISFTGILDELENTPLSAFSLRLLTGSYTGYCCRIRRSSDNAIADVRFYNDGGSYVFALDSAVSMVSGTSDAISLGEFVGASGYDDVDSLGSADSADVVVFYDQMEFEDLIQATPANQPRIITDGVIETKNGKPTIFFDVNTDKILETDTFAERNPSHTTVYAMQSMEGSSGSYGELIRVAGSNIIRDAGNIKYRATVSNEGSFAANPASSFSEWGLFCRLSHYPSTDSNCYFNVFSPPYTRLPGETRYSSATTEISYTSNRIRTQSGRTKQCVSELIAFEDNLNGTDDDAAYKTDTINYFNMTPTV